jgi:hypothetical protein
MQDQGTASIILVALDDVRIQILLAQSIDLILLDHRENYLTNGNQTLREFFIYAFGIAVYLNRHDIGGKSLVPTSP